MALPVGNMTAQIAAADLERLGDALSRMSAQLGITFDSAAHAFAQFGSAINRFPPTYHGSNDERAADVRSIEPAGRRYCDLPDGD